MEQEPVMRLTMASGEFEATRDNTFLFTFLGKAGINLAMYDHVYIRMDEEGEEPQGAYIFSINENFQPMADFMLENKYTAHLNMSEVAECDVTAFNNMIRDNAEDLDNGIPEEWQ